MSRLSKNLTKQERLDAHKAKMAGKKYDAARYFAHRPTPMQAALARIPAGAFSRLVNANRHTLEPHTHKREIARHERQAAI